MVAQTRHACVQFGAQTFEQSVASSSAGGLGHGFPAWTVARKLNVLKRISSGIYGWFMEVIGQENIFSEHNVGSSDRYFCKWRIQACMGAGIKNRCWC
jgi:hypothetical protein